MVGAAVAYLVTVAATGGGPAAARGWGVPMATDVAFTLGAMALLGRRVPPALRVFVLALAVADDVGSVIVLAVISASHVHVRPWVLAAAVVWFAVVRSPAAEYGPRGGRTSSRALVEWALLAWGGVEPTLAGAFVGMIVPCAALPATARRPATKASDRAPSSTDRSPSAVLERVLNPVSILFILPLFALANTGVDLGTPGLTSGAGGSVVVGVLVARLVGKMGGITVATAIIVRCRAVKLPEGDRWSQLAGAAAMCGMGFTVPLLFATSAFAGHPPLVAAARSACSAARPSPSSAAGRSSWPPVAGDIGSQVGAQTSSAGSPPSVTRPARRRPTHCQLPRPRSPSRRRRRAGDAGAADAAVAVGVLRQVLLVIVLGVVERARRGRSRS